MASITIGILHHEEEPKEAFSIKDPKYDKAHRRLMELAIDRGHRIVRVPVTAYNEKQGAFEFGYDMSHPDWARTDGLLQPDVVWDRSPAYHATHDLKLAMSSVFPIVNDPRLTLLFSEKTTPELLFPDLAIASRIVRRSNDLEEAIASLKGDQLVIKPMSGSGGKGVEIRSREMMAEFDLSGGEEWVLQELIDTTQGVPGLTEGPHDLRLVFVGSKISYSYLRIPQRGSLISNVARGGTMVDVPLDTLPDAMRPVAEVMLERFSLFRFKLFTADFLFQDGTTPRLVELNYSPGVYFQEEDKEVQTRFYEDILDLLEKAAASVS
ncbi:MAG: hypothetical protein KC925_02010 [Candidatus Doudnabacteria bacterium]|nr:hypothetical protein [Candidatus Doudnabacteria bacterium]MCA9387965.1 hypothetical protein [Candidatus Andersenbacteria bacterium]